MICGECSDTGTIVAPHPQCVWNGQLANYRFKDGADYGRVVTIAILCTYCDLGRAEISLQERAANQASGSADHRSKTLMTADQYFERLQGHDGVTMLREYERRKSEECRKACPRTSDHDDMYTRMIERLR